MLGIVIATHGTLSNGLKGALEVILGFSENLTTLNLLANDDVQNLKDKIKKAVLEVNQGDGVIVLTDIVSASPYNQSLLMVQELEKDIQDNIYVIGGVNLPMLIETVNHQLLQTPVHQIADAVVEQGKGCIQSWHIHHNVEEDDEEDGF